MSREEQNSQSSGSILFATFLESVPPGAVHEIPDLFEDRPIQYGSRWYVTTPALQLHCPSEGCRGPRFFRSGDTHFVDKGAYNFFLLYTCRNCGKSWKTFALRLIRTDTGSASGQALKFGELPTFGPPVPARVITMIGPDRELFLKGRRSEIQGLGIGAFTYYRRVVENQKDRLFDEIYKAAERLGAQPEVLQEIETAKKQTQFSNAVDRMKDAIPDGLKVKGHNPLKLLHSALSKGVHSLTDEECLERAQAIRVVLTELATNIGQVMKDEHELDAAVNKLLSL
jgi:hypothetical protein